MVQKKKVKVTKRPAGLVIDPPAPRPITSDDPSLKLFREAKEAQARQDSATPATQGTLGSLGTQGTQSEQPIAPSRDYMKVANSINRAAMRSGAFKGKSKQIYDYLYERTRGAIVPVRTVCLTRKEIMKGAHIGSDKTLRENLRHLRLVGLLDWNEQIGVHEGNEYTVYLPEETLGTQGSQGTQSITTVNAYTSEKSQTLFKTNTERDDDDAALAELVASLKQAAKDVTGKETSQAESDRWRELAEVLVAEMKIAAARTTVSSAPAFLAEHLRRRLWKIDKKQANAEGRELPDQATIAVPAEETKGCPDCSGSGWWYPNGPERGVAKCRHERLEEKLTEIVPPSENT